MRTHIRVDRLKNYCDSHTKNLGIHEEQLTGLAWNLITFWVIHHMLKFRGRGVLPFVKISHVTWSEHWCSNKQEVSCSSDIPW